MLQRRVDFTTYQPLIASCGGSMVESVMPALPDFTGQRFNHLLVLSSSLERNIRRATTMCQCLCDCGKEVTVAAHRLKNGRTKSCGCLVKNNGSKKGDKHKRRIPIERIGQKFNHLIIQDIRKIPGKKGWEASCLCDCGKMTSANLQAVCIGRTKSCGCLRHVTLRILNTTHGHTNSPEYGIYKAMIARCHSPVNRSYKNYGGREKNPITVCDEWRKGFQYFLDDVGERPSAAHSLGRIDNDKGYCPDNVRWETIREQVRNTRHNRIVHFRSMSKTLVEWTEELGLPYQVVIGRLDLGWSSEDAFTTPVDSGKNKKRMVTAFGETLWMSEWARRYGLSLGNLKYRLNRGMAPEEALTLLPNVKRVVARKNREEAPKKSKETRHSIDSTRGLRNNAERAAIARDDRTCQRCGTRSGAEKKYALILHHIVSAAYTPLVNNFHNLIVLCPKCHGWVHAISLNTEHEYLIPIPTDEASHDEAVASLMAYWEKQSSPLS